MRIQLAAVGLLSVFALGACNMGGFKKTKKTGMEYKILKSGSGKMVTDSSAVELALVAKTEKDSIFQNSEEVKPGQKSRPLILDLGSPDLTPFFKEMLTVLKAGDSALFRVNTDSIFKMPVAQRPAPFNKKANDHIKFVFKVKKVLTHEQYMTKMTAIREEMRVEMKKAQDAQLKIDEAGLQKYMTDNKIKAERDSTGLYYVVDKPGTGAFPKQGEMVKVNYIGKLMDGTIFDQSKGKPFELPLGYGQVIPGWEIGIPKFKKGGKGKLIIPSALAYGPRGSGSIPANANLLFEIEIVDINPMPANPGGEQPGGGGGSH